MSSDNKQILELAKQGLTAAEIAISLNYDVEAVELVLSSDKEVAKELEKFNVDRVQAMDSSLDKLRDKSVTVLEEIMTDPYEKGSVRATIAIFVAEHQLGLKKPRLTVNNLTIFDINERMLAVKQRKAILDQKVIEVEAVKV